MFWTILSTFFSFFFPVPYWTILSTLFFVPFCQLFSFQEQEEEEELEEEELEEVKVLH